jgi:hypothetical protein
VARRERDAQLTRAWAAGARAAARPARARLSMRPPLILAAVMLAAVVLVPDGPTTDARWTDQASAELGAIEHGTLDLLWNGQASDTLTLSDLALGGMLPGDSRAVTINGRNDSAEAPLSYTVYARATNPNLATPLTVQLFLDGAATNSGSATTGYSGTCTGTSLGAARPMSTGDAAVGTIAGPLAPGSTHTLCVRVAMATDAPLTAQGQTGQIVLTALARSMDR